MPTIAISYRRADSAGTSGRIFDRLVAHYGDGSIFMDVDDIPFGVDFRDHIRDVLSKSDLVLAVIGPRWFSDGNENRINDDKDPVRVEIQTAFERQIPLIPVLVDGARMPSADHLPDGLKDLAFRNAAEVAPGRDFRVHIDRLIRSIDKLIAGRSGLGQSPGKDVGAPEPSPSVNVNVEPPVLSNDFLDNLARTITEPPAELSLQDDVVASTSGDRKSDIPSPSERRMDVGRDAYPTPNAGDAGSAGRHFRFATPRPRHSAHRVPILIVIGGLFLTVGAYAYRSYTTAPGATQPPPVITAGNQVNKNMPASARDPRASKQDQPANAGKEQLVSKQEEPVLLRELQSGPRVVLPAPVRDGSPSGAAPSNEPKKVTTIPIRSDGTDVTGRPVPGATPPVPKTPAPAEPGVSEPAPRARTANASAGFVVQLASQKTEEEAQASFRNLQAKFPNELGNREPIIRRADMGSKGVWYRTMVGPFGSAQEANQFCTSYKAAGGQCVVPSN
jgi:hypothetical protein